MKQKSTMVIFILTVCLFMLCCKTGVLVRFKNDTGYNMTKLTVKYWWPNDSLYNFYNIADKQTTQYIRVPYSMPYCWTVAIINNDTIKAIPIDYIGEPKYKSGKLTIKYAFCKDKNGRLVKDQNGIEARELSTQAKRWLCFNDIVIYYYWTGFLYKVFRIKPKE